MKYIIFNVSGISMKITTKKICKASSKKNQFLKLLLKILKQQYNISQNEEYKEPSGGMGW